MRNSYITVLDQFCGAGGSSLGATMAGAEVLVALNHWKLAIETHNTNFPQTYHECTDISACDPRRYPSTNILITSPECTNHSLAKGKKRAHYKTDLLGNVLIDHAEERSRATMWDVVRFAECHRNEIILTENVVDVRDWVLFDEWLRAMQKLGYEWECVYFNSMFAHPTPQSRDRVYIVFWRSGNRRPNLDIRPLAWCAKCDTNVESVQSWKNPTKRHGRYGKHGQYFYTCPSCLSVVQPYYYPALNAIDWSLPIQRIGDRKKPLEERTMQRIRLGLERFKDMHIMVDILYSQGHDKRSYPVIGAWPTQTGQQSLALIKLPWLQAMTRDDLARSVMETARTQTGTETQALVVPFLGVQRTSSTPRGLDEVFQTIVTDNQHFVVMPQIVELRKNGAARGADEPLATVVASGNHHGLLMPFIASYYNSDNLRKVSDALGTQPGHDRHALVAPMPFIASQYTGLSRNAVAATSEPTPTVPGMAVHYLAQPHPSEPPRVEDCGFRMLEPHEVQAAMAFPGEYKVLGNKRERVKQLGNAVTPPVMEMLLRRCIESLEGKVA